MTSQTESPGILDAEELVAAKAGDFTAAEWRELQQVPSSSTATQFLRLVSFGLPGTPGHRV